MGFLIGDEGSIEASQPLNAAGQLVGTGEAVAAGGRATGGAHSRTGRATGRSPGAQPHERHGRSLLPVAQVDELVPIKPAAGATAARYAPTSASAWRRSTQKAAHYGWPTAAARIRSSSAP